jgi:putative oxidoreductase
MPDRNDTDVPTSIGLLILRLGIGGYLATHGWGKLQMALAGNYAMMGDPIGIGAVPSLWLLVLAELVCALLVVVGLGTRLATVPVIVAMGVAAFVAHGADPWTTEQGARLFMEGKAKFWGSKQPALTFLIVFLALAFTGAGRFSLDTVIRRWRLRRNSRPSPPEST